VDPLAGRTRVWAFGLALALVTAPAEAQPGRCPNAPLEALAEQLPEARRFAVAGPLLGPLVALWPVAPQVAERLHPDAATLFAVNGRPVLVALTRDGCVVGAFQAEWAAVLRSLREELGPAI
jgi:hypothetical protein